MTHRIPLVVAALSCGLAGLAGAQTASVSPRSLAGDWEYVLSPSQKLVLHLHVAANGVMTGTIDEPGSPPKQIELRDVHLAGIMLTYTLPPQPAP